MIQFSSVTMCQQLIERLEEQEGNIIQTLNHRIDPAIPEQLKKRFKLIILLAVATSTLLSTLSIAQWFDHDYDKEINYINIAGTVFVILMALMGYVTLRNINDKHLGLTKEQKEAISNHGKRAQELADSLKTEAVLNKNFNTYTEAVLNNAGNILTHYSNTSSALAAADSIQIATQHAKFLITNPTISKSEDECLPLQTALFDMFEITHKLGAEANWLQLKHHTLMTIATLLILGLPTGLSITSSFENERGKFISLGASAASFIIGALLLYVTNKMNMKIQPDLSATFENHRSELVGSLLKYFPDNQLETSDRQLISLILHELKNPFKLCRSVNDLKNQASHVQAALEQTLVYAQAKFTLFTVPDRDNSGEKKPLLSPV